MLEHGLGINDADIKSNSTLPYFTFIINSQNYLYLSFKFKYWKSVFLLSSYGDIGMELNTGVKISRQELLLAEHRRLNRYTPLVESDAQAMKVIIRARRYFLQIHEVIRKQIICELVNVAFLHFRMRRIELSSIGEELREGLLFRMTVTGLKKFVESDRIQSEYCISMSGSKALHTGIDQEIQMNLEEYANKKIKPIWNKQERQTDLRMAIDTLPSLDCLILNLWLESFDKSEIITILESNEIRNGRKLIDKSIQKLRIQLCSNN